MTDQEILCSMVLAATPHLKHADRIMLLETFKSASELYQQRHNLCDILPAISQSAVDIISNMDSLMPRAEQELQFAHNNDIQCLCYNSTNYPSRLRECANAPILLYYKGNANLNCPRVINMVGTRHCTEYGKDICRTFVTELSALCPDILIISGLAYGIDIHSHRAALQNNLNTVAVMAHGLDYIYPAIHRDTAKQMISQGGIITEYMSQTNVDKKNFISRNRIIAGMADATIVVESAIKGGSLITARFAIDYNRDVFAFPGRISDPYSQGCHALIRENTAALITSASDFLSTMNWTSNNTHKSNTQPIQRQIFPDLDPQETLIVDLLRNVDEIHSDEISQKTNIPIHKLNFILLNLETNGIIKSLAGNRYRLLM